MNELQKQIENGSIHTNTNFFLDVYKQTEKAVNVNYFGKKVWIPKSVFQEQKFGDLIVFGMKQWFINKLEKDLRYA